MQSDMKILIVGVVNNPQLTRLVEEAEKRGHTTEGCYSSDLVIVANEEKFEATVKGKPLSEYDLIYLWAFSKRRWEWITAVSFVNRKYGTTIVNSKVINPSFEYYLTPAIDYLVQKQNDLPFPKSAIVYNAKGAKQVVADFDFPLILKTSTGRQGKGVFKVNSLKELNQKIKEIKDTSPSFVIREFIPNEGDIRVFTVGYKAIGAMERTPVKGDFRSNISQGGSGAEYDLTKKPKVRELAEKASRVLKTEIAGVDIIFNKENGKPYILEINPGPQFAGLEKYTKTNAALEIIKYFESLGK